MKQAAISTSDFSRSVWAVPPLAHTPEGALDAPSNRALAAHVEASGVSTILWGGNANIYAMTEAEFANLVAAIPDWVDADTWAIPSVGPDPGKLRAHADALRGRGYPAALLLPYNGLGDAAGREAMIRNFADRAALPAILYLRSADYLPPDRIAKMIDEGVIAGLKYAVETGDLTQDSYLDAVLSGVPAERIVSGIGEIAAIPHLTTFGLAGFTAGAVCMAPRRAMAILRALQAGDSALAEALSTPIAPLEELRMAHGPIPILHAAVATSGLANLGALGPPFGQLSEDLRAAVAAAVVPLLAAEAELTEAA